ncbi:MAG: hypothetical protein QOE90_2088 [Thermoplasmata archaeon]|jgi:hypothetical protein|nr:hypothetical protein [Thermoplasmata archaeon]
MDLRWRGGLEDALALARLLAAGRDVTLVPAPDEVVPAFLVQAQAAALALATKEAGDAGWRAFVCASPEKDDLGRFVEETPPGARTLVVDGPLFARRVEVVAGDVVPWGAGWRLALDLKGC